MTPAQLFAISALKGCVFYPGTATKRFVRDMQHYPIDKPLSDKQDTFLVKTYIRFRKQHGKGLIIEF